MEPCPITHRSRKIILTLAGLWLLLYASFTLFSPPLLDDADSVHAEVAREMVPRHDWITLYANGIRYLEKAPLMYWSMAASFTLFGPQDWAARLPLAVATLALFLVVYATGRRLFASDTAGFYAALILLTSFGIFIYTRILIPDVIVCLWLSLAMLMFWISLEQPQPSRGPHGALPRPVPSTCSPRASSALFSPWPSSSSSCCSIEIWAT